MLRALRDTEVALSPASLAHRQRGLLMLLEVAGTRWVWWLLAERPPPLAFAGGAGVQCNKRAARMRGSLECRPRAADQTRDPHP